VNAQALHAEDVFMVQALLDDPGAMWKGIIINEDGWFDGNIQDLILAPLTCHGSLLQVEEIGLYDIILE
jgi:hypothetical protein